MSCHHIQVYRNMVFYQRIIVDTDKSTQSIWGFDRRATSIRRILMLSTITVIPVEQKLLSFVFCLQCAANLPAIKKINICMITTIQFILFNANSAATGSQQCDKCKIIESNFQRSFPNSKVAAMYLCHYLKRRNSDVEDWRVSKYSILL